MRFILWLSAIAVALGCICSCYLPVNRHNHTFFGGAKLTANLYSFSYLFLVMMTFQMTYKLCFEKNVWSLSLILEPLQILFCKLQLHCLPQNYKNSQRRHTYLSCMHKPVSSPPPSSSYCRFMRVGKQCHGVLLKPIVNSPLTSSFVWSGIANQLLWQIAPPTVSDWFIC